MTPGSSLPAIAPSVLPADVRAGSKQDQQTYRAALGFERMLLGQLTKQMMESAKPAGGEEESAATSTYRDMMPDQLADSVIANGGIGMAHDLFLTLRKEGR